MLKKTFVCFLALLLFVGCSQRASFERTDAETMAGETLVKLGYNDLSFSDFQTNEEEESFTLIGQGVCLGQDHEFELLFNYDGFSKTWAVKEGLPESCDEILHSVELKRITNLQALATAFEFYALEHSHYPDVGASSGLCLDRNSSLWEEVNVYLEKDLFDHKEMEASVYQEIDCKGFPYLMTFNQGAGYGLAIEILDGGENVAEKTLICGDITKFTSLDDWSSSGSCGADDAQYYFISSQGY